MLNCTATCRGRDKKPADNRVDQISVRTENITETVMMNLERGLSVIRFMTKTPVNMEEWFGAEKEEPETHLDNVSKLAENLFGE